MGRVAYIQVIQADRLIHESNLRSLRTKTLPSDRGTIMDRNSKALAISVPARAIWADPAMIMKEKEITNLKYWYALADALGCRGQELIDKIRKNQARRFIYLQRQVSLHIAGYIQGLNLTGVGSKPESKRYYPSGEVSAHLVGMTGIDGHGLEGVERSYDQWLSGEPGKRIFRKDRHGRVVENIALNKCKKGKDLTLTVDQRLQTLAYRTVMQAMVDYRAHSASAVLLDIKRSSILAMVNAPSYNPNNRSNLVSSQMRNRVITDIVEPGSTVKPFVVLSALANGIADRDTAIDTGDGVFTIGGSRVIDVSKVGKASLREIIKKSSNIGVAKLALQMPVEALLGVYQSVGLGVTSGSGLVGENTGIYPLRPRWSRFEVATLAFGYGIAVTPIQLAHAYATLGNLGKYGDLNIFESHGEVISRPRQAIDKKYARQVLDYLEAATQRGGSATNAAVPGYRIGAKTGTSRKATVGGYGDEYVALTAGVAPVSDPRLALVVVVNEPQGDQYYGGQVAAPVFAEIMRGALQMLNIAPDGT